MNEALILEAPAKLNLSLRVLRRREDGFHEIDSLMVRLPGLCDRLTFRPAASDAFSCDDPSVPSDGSNLVLKARDAYRVASGRAQPLAIHLEKRVPHGAGLGGGSSDAAATLQALDRLSDEPLGTERLMEIAATLGSDIPFFLGGATARARGRGERIDAAPNPPALRLVLLKPSFGVATPDAYGRWAGSKELPGILYAPQRFPWGELVNDLERPVFWKHLFLAETKAWLLARPEVAGALMSGSGSTMFAVLRSGAEAGPMIDAARSELDPTLWAWSGTLGD
ncbi:MAG: 4-(cytidine 5'-diphospho)-2-C-methyl-D-erythritol kinase [Verrucomicrobia bacterium]|nr:MAG: 4-(cytidine 5'-diphospho)-2-C-methyl-D-erythritol kinase [Verrucomicrobiota bacterium]TAE85233.1 MAG: 4-(cytidine 5'-diphospho)-2-C-methyl-D-erythritol kinase [Verrucomicrobiota bacterium]TAF22825.1 MAG: 4-(cytidine 5'-diphospho)-2-C-methyl-D-erythritol kinase [Verrucomicrobiota bacterium]TAF39898.1 MAG: 4-(cytidine 5'-diphospho)-2-C-methyl-D-erythritol kinase [Verrucomicrobiota bacterium]